MILFLHLLDNLPKSNWLVCFSYICGFELEESTIAPSLEADSIQPATHCWLVKMQKFQEQCLKQVVKNT